MAVPLIQKIRITQYILSKKIHGRRRYPLVLMLEPLFQCNLTCSGCGKINYSQEILKRRIGLDECLSAVDECGAPIVSIAGGEPLLHKDMSRIVAGIVQRRKFVYLCTNGILLKKHIHKYKPSPYFTFSIHLDGNREHHDASVSMPGAFDTAVEAIKTARAAGFQVTINCTLYNGLRAEAVGQFFDFIKGLDLNGISISPGFRYEQAPCENIFLERMASKRFFREIFKLGKGRKWRFNNTSLYLDFLAGNQSYQCSPWGNPTRNIFGWQKPCYLLPDEGYARSFQGLMEETHWEKYGVGRNPKCKDCMLHSGFEATAVDDMFAHPLKALRVACFGVRTSGPMVKDFGMSGNEAIGKIGIQY